MAASGGDDEDTRRLLKAESVWDAVDDFIEYMRDFSGVGSEDRARLEAVGEDVSFSGIFESQTEIKEST